MGVYVDILGALDDFLYPAVGAVPSAACATLKAFIDTSEGRVFRFDDDTEALPDNLTRADCPVIWGEPTETTQPFTTNVYQECRYAVTIYGALHTRKWKDAVGFYEIVQAALFSGFGTFFVEAAGDYQGHAVVAGLSTFNDSPVRWATMRGVTAANTFRIFGLELTFLCLKNPRT